MVPRIVIGTPDGGKTRHNRREVKDTEGKEGVRQKGREKENTERGGGRHKRAEK